MQKAQTFWVDVLYQKHVPADSLLRRQHFWWHFFKNFLTVEENLIFFVEGGTWVFVLNSCQLWTVDCGVTGAGEYHLHPSVYWHSPSHLRRRQMLHIGGFDEDANLHHVVCWWCLSCGWSKSLILPRIVAFLLIEPHLYNYWIEAVPYRCRSKQNLARVTVGSVCCLLVLQSRNQFHTISHGLRIAAADSLSSSSKLYKIWQHVLIIYTGDMADNLTCILWSDANAFMKICNDDQVKEQKSHFWNLLLCGNKSSTTDIYVFNQAGQHM